MADVYDTETYLREIEGVLVEALLDADMTERRAHEEAARLAPGLLSLIGVTDNDNLARVLGARIDEAIVAASPPRIVRSIFGPQYAMDIVAALQQVNFPGLTPESDQ